MTSPRCIFSTPIIAFPSIGIKTFIESDLHLLAARAVLEAALEKVKMYDREWFAIKKDLCHLGRIERGLHDMEDYT